MLSQPVASGNKYILCDFMETGLLGAGSWELAPNFLQILPYGPFLSADFALYVFVVINYMLRPVSPT